MEENFSDAAIARLISDCRELMKNYPAVSKMTACYNLTLGVFKIFSIRGEKDWVQSLAKKFSKDLMKEIKNMYEQEFR